MNIGGDFGINQKLMKKLLFIFLLFFLNNNSYALYEIYKCSNEEQLESCSEGCVKSKFSFGTTYNFKVNVQNSSVIMEYFRNGKYSSSRNLQNCAVIDKDNWMCSKTTTYPDSGISSTTSEIMRNSIFRITFSSDMYNLDCSKKF